MPFDPALVDLIAKLLLVVLGIVIAIISFFLRGLITDFRALQQRQHQLEIEVASASNRATDTATDLERMEDKMEVRFREVATRQDRLETSLNNIARDLAGVLSSLQHVTESLQRTEAKMDDVSQRLSRIEGKRP